jgi:hypothetical protein
MEKGLKRFELAANVAIIVVAALIAFVVIKNYVLAPVKRAPEMKEIAAGERLNLPGIDWAANGRTLIVAMAEGCHFCSESAPFYQRLAKLQIEKGGFQFVAVLPQEPIEAKNYLTGMRVNIDNIQKASLDSIEVVGTPTLILVNGSGFVSNVWIGKLPTDKENEVLSALAPAKTGA